jgi:nucleotide-binding universal stress UspA family protein
MFERLLIATDLNDGLQRLVSHGSDLYQTGVQSITFVHAVPFDESGGMLRPDQATIDQRLDRLRYRPSAMPPPMPELDYVVESGKPTAVILNALQKSKPDVLLMGMGVCNLLSEKLFGSTTLGVLKHTHTPLMILRPPLLKTFLQEEMADRCQFLWRHLLIPFDGSKAAEALMAHLQQTWQQAGVVPPSLVTLCWVVDTMAEPQNVIAERAEIANQKMRALQTELANVEVRVEVRYGNPVIEILTAAQEVTASAIVVSSGNVGGLRELSVPSFAGEMLRRSWHPVLFFSVSK